jgi:hypothetical protein
MANDASISGLTVGKGAGAVSSNTAVGNTSLSANTTGTFNTSVGTNSLASNTSGGDNVSYGGYALNSNTTGNANVGIGTSALRLNTTASNNTAVGYQAGYKITTGENNTCMGYQAGYAITTGSLNVSVGRLSMDTSVAITGQQNNAVGNGTLRNLTSGSYNNAMGSGAMQATTTGSNNVAIGQNCLRETTTGSSNTAIGFDAGYSNTTGADNTIVGKGAGYNLTTGYRNTLIGTSAGADSGSTQITTGFQNIVIGWACDISASGGDNQIVLGSDASGKGNSTGYLAAASVYNASNTSTWNTTSDSRLKKNIVDNNNGLGIINQIKVRNFEYRLPEEVDAALSPKDAIKKQGVQLGVIAQEIQQVLPECVKEQSTGVLSVDTDNLIWYLVNAVKELKAEIDQLKGN